MSAAILLRLAALLAVLETVGHTVLFVSATPKRGPQEVAVFDAMKGNLFSFSGSVHSYWELYFGYGLFVTIACAAEAALLWQLAAAPMRSTIAVFLVMEIAFAALMLRYFFIIPQVSHVAMAILLAGAFFAARAYPLPR